MKEPGVDLGQSNAASSRAIDSQHHFVSARRWRSACTKSRRDKAVGIAHAGERDGKRNSVGRATNEHRSAIQRKSAHALKGKVGPSNKLTVKW